MYVLEPSLALPEANPTTTPFTYVQQQRTNYSSQECFLKEKKIVFFL
jgi:hypothetical protein